MNETPALRVLRASSEHTRALEALFERSGCACYCRYWHFPGDKNAWLERLAHHPSDNRAEMAQALLEGSPEMQGLVALDGIERAVGWMKLAPAACVAKLYEQRLYRGLPCFTGDRTGVFTVGCFLVDSEYRRQGVASALVEHAVELARRAGARAIEAFPRRAEHVSDGELWLGPESVFRRAGFEEVHAFAPYPVLRRTL